MFGPAASTSAYRSSPLASRIRYAWWTSTAPDASVEPTEQYLVTDSSIARRTASGSMPSPSTHVDDVEARERVRVMLALERR